MIYPAARSGGPIPKFNEYHLWKALYFLDDKKAIGRKKLSSLLNIGEGSIRTIISIFQENQLININKSGILLTSTGMEQKKKYRMDVMKIVIDSPDVENISIDKCNCAVRIPRLAHSVKFGCEERDAAIKAGATGATTLVYINGELLFPGSEYRVNQSVEQKIKNLFTPRNDDVIIIGTGPTDEIAEIGAVSAGLGIMNGLRFTRSVSTQPVPNNENLDLVSLAFAIHDLVGGLPVCAKMRNNLGIRIENGAVIDNAYTGAVLEEVLQCGTTIRKIAVAGPYKGIRVIVTPIEIDNRTIAVIGVVDIRSMAGINNLIRLKEDEEFEE